MSDAVRLEQARAVVRSGGFPDAEVEAAGHDGSIAVITRVPGTSAPALAALAGRIKALGFRYVTIDITGAV